MRSSRFPPDKIKVLHNSYPPSFLERDREEERTRARKAYGIGENDFLVLALGRLRFIKGFTVLVEAMRLLQDPRVKRRMGGYVKQRKKILTSRQKNGII